MPDQIARFDYVPRVTKMVCHRHKDRPRNRPRHMGTVDSRRLKIVQVREKNFPESFQTCFQ